MFRHGGFQILETVPYIKKFIGGQASVYGVYVYVYVCVYVLVTSHMLESPCEVSRSPHGVVLGNELLCVTLKNMHLEWTECLARAPCIHDLCSDVADCLGEFEARITAGDVIVTFSLTNGLAAGYTSLLGSVGIGVNNLLHGCVEAEFSLQVGYLGLRGKASGAAGLGLGLGLGVGIHGGGGLGLRRAALVWRLIQVSNFFEAAPGATMLRAETHAEVTRVRMEATYTAIQKKEGFHLHQLERTVHRR